MSLDGIDLEIFLDNKEVVMNIKYKATGEIRQKRRSINWFFKRIFKYELKRWEKYGEHLIIDKLFLIKNL